MNTLFSTFYRLTLFLCLVQTVFCSAQDIPEAILKMEDSLLNKFAISKNDTTKIDELYHLSRNIFDYDLKKGMKYINQSIQLAERIDDAYGKMAGHQLKGIILYYMSRHDLSQEELFLAIKLNEEVQSKRSYASIYNYIGMNYSKIEEIDKSKTYYEKSLPYYKMLNDSSGIGNIYNNLGYMLFKRDKYEEASDYLHKAISYYKDTSYIINSNINLIHIDLKKEQYGQAYDKLTYIKSLESSLHDFLDKAEFYYLFGLYYMDTRNYENAISYLQKSLELSKERGISDFVKLSLEKLSEIYSFKKDYKKSLELFKKYAQVNDSISDQQTKKQIAQLELNHEYDNNLVQIKHEQQEKKMWYLIFGLSLFVVCIVLGTLYWLQKKRIKITKEKHVLIQKNLKNKLQDSTSEKLKLKYELNSKKKELVFKNNELLNSALEIIKNHELLTQISKKIKLTTSKLEKEENIKKIKELDSFVKQTMNLEKSRKEFYGNITELHKTFLFDLNSKFPNLSSKEKELALMLRLGYSSKDISILSNISPSSVDMARYRLRKKLNLSSDKKLQDFFDSLSNTHACTDVA
ncbi:tetratricopeptide repeat protein [Aquimarina rubra]|uniref:Tetratricopeptide repeat protein n=1 Tax=Aquimarina rubra TaxID=1920033 RepID=A0ABW5LF14_9FLAO